MMSVFPALSNEDTESLQKQLGSLNEHATLLVAQCATVHQKRHIIRERQRVHTTALSFLQVPEQHSFAESEDSYESVLAFYEQSESRFSHSLLSLSPSSVEIQPPQPPDIPLRSPKRKSMLAKLDGKLRSIQQLQFRPSKRSSKPEQAHSVTKS